MAEMTTVQPQAPAPAPAPAPAQGKPPLKKKGAQKKKMAKRLIVLAVAAAVCLGGGFALHRFLNSGSGDLGEIYAQPASIGSIQSTVSGSGTAKAKESAAITLTQSGTVQEVLVAGGDTVTAGQPLYTIYSQAAEDEVNNARKALTDLQKDMADLQKDVSNLTVRAPFSGKLMDVKDFQTDQDVSKGTPVATIVNDKKLKLTLYFSYAYENSVKKGQAVTVSVPAVMGDFSGYVDDIHKVSYISPEGAVHFEAVKALANFHATAPIDGTVTSCSLVEGEDVKSGDTVIIISNNTTMLVTITVDDRNISYIKPGSYVDLTWNDATYQGLVTSIDMGKAESGQGMTNYPVVLTVDNPDGSLIEGAYLQYSFVTSQSDNCILVPTSAVKYVSDLDGNRQSVVFVQRDERPDDVPELDLPDPMPGEKREYPSEKDGYYPVIVSTGLSDAQNVEITSGLEDGDTVFVNYTVTYYSYN